MPIPSCIHVFIFPHILGSYGTFLIIHPSFTWISHVAEPSEVFILHVFNCFLIFHAHEIYFGAME